MKGMPPDIPTSPFTARKTLVKEVRHVFDFIEKPYLPVKFKELLVSPNDMRSKLLKLIEEEVKNARKQKTARILGKVNHITDRTLIAKLYEASAAGVKIDLVVRGNCSIVTGNPGNKRKHPDQRNYRPLSGTFTNFHFRKCR